jgi:hypothetical protein
MYISRESKQLAEIGIGGWTAHLRLRLQDVGLIDELHRELVSLRVALKEIKEAQYWIDAGATLATRTEWEEDAKRERKVAVRRSKRLVKSLCNERRLFEVGRLAYALNHTHDNVVGGGETVLDPEW